MQINYKPNRLTSTGMDNGLEEFCFLRIARKCGAQITEAELSVSVHVKRPSSARPDDSAALPDVTSVTSLGFRRDILPSRTFLDFLNAWLGTSYVRNRCGNPSSYFQAVSFHQCLTTPHFTHRTIPYRRLLVLVLIWPNVASISEESSKELFLQVSLPLLGP
jgi:hypothetical protein